jgi:hypothetical protein
MLGGLQIANCIKNRIPAFVYKSTADRNFHITPLPKRLRARREFGAKIRQDCRQLIGNFRVITGGSLPKESLGFAAGVRQSWAIAVRDGSQISPWSASNQTGLVIRDKRADFFPHLIWHSVRIEATL